jgi:hypothetical protein
MNFEITKIVEYFNDSLNVKSIVFGIILILFVLFSLFFIFQISIFRKRPKDYWQLKFELCRSILINGFLLNAINVFLLIFTDYYEKFNLYFAVILILWIYCGFAFYYIFNLQSEFKSKNNKIHELIPSHFNFIKSKFKKSKSLDNLKILWFVLFVPYIFTQLSFIFTPNYSLIFDNSGSMIQSIQDAKEFVQKEFVKSNIGNIDLLLTTIPSSDNNYSGVLKEIQNRLTRENAQSGEIQVSLKWDNVNDLDLHCYEPSGNEIFFAKRVSPSGGNLDVDMNAGLNFSPAPIENIYFPFNKVAAGKYKISVNYYSKHSTTVDGGNYEVLLYIQGRYYLLNGYIGRVGSTQQIVEFDYNPNLGIVDSKVLTPNSVQKKSLNIIKSISEIRDLDENELVANTVSVNNKQSLIDTISLLQANGIGSPISQLIKHNYLKAVDKFRGNFLFNHLVIVTDGADESLLKGIYTDEDFILEYDDLIKGVKTNPFDFYNSIDLIIYPGYNTDAYARSLQDLASVNKKVKIHYVKKDNISAYNIFENVFKYALVDWEFIILCMLPILIFGLILILKKTSF